MNFEKLRNINNRPLDYLSQRNCRSTVQNREMNGTKMIGWQVKKLNEGMGVKRTNPESIRFIDNMNKNKFTQHHGKFARIMDKTLRMKKGFPYSRLDIRRQRKLIKKADKLISISDTNHSKQNSASKVRSKSKIDNHFSIVPATGRKTITAVKAKSILNKLYDQVYSDKMDSHSQTPFAKFPYNLDKDSIVDSNRKMASSTIHGPDSQNAIHIKPVAGRPNYSSFSTTE